MSDNEIFLFLSLLVVAAGFGIIVLGLRHRTRVLELAHRERLAMIERGIALPPERESFAHRPSASGPRPRPAAAERRLAFGIGLVGWGVGIAILFAFAFESPSGGVGFGGAFAAVGAALIVTALVARRADDVQGWQPPATSVPPFDPASRSEPAPPEIGERH